MGSLIKKFIIKKVIVSRAIKTIKQKSLIVTVHKKSLQKKILKNQFRNNWNFHQVHYQKLILGLNNQIDNQYLTKNTIFTKSKFN